MADAFTFALNGSFGSTPQSSPMSFAPQVVAQLAETLQIGAQQITEMTLGTDGAHAVDFGGVGNAHVVILKSTGGKIIATVTSADGTAQTIPFDTYWILLSMASPITSLSLTRVAGQETTCRIFLAEQA